MTEARGLPSLFSRYALIARIYPAIICTAPAAWTAVVLFPQLHVGVRSLLASMILGGCFVYLMSSLSRSKGKAAEAKLLTEWGGWPTTRVLRNRDSTIDPITKARYHRALATMMGLDALPSSQEEAQDPVRADAAYISATKRLSELRRGKSFRMLEDENAAYGFRRNLYGLKPVMISIAILAALTTVLVWCGSASRPSDFTALAAVASSQLRLPALLIADCAFLLIACFSITRKFVRQAAEEYALALFRTLDQG